MAMAGTGTGVATQVDLFEEEVVILKSKAV
jgi:hypothetical protein